ncbi:hypothetical protein [Pumilibacter intestinalis]|uniref:hypothetical protein n=1 Tax=Pumilibacter intestinalis TaxID=2941511 RepID=UPI00203B985E|nr:hypothetical protein [Pumilibacter intestinalis]
MLKKIISAIYVVTLLVIVVCVPLSAIFVVCKLCGATPLSWLGACVPLLIAFAVLPCFILSKILLDIGNK